MQSSSEEMMRMTLSDIHARRMASPARHALINSDLRRALTRHGAVSHTQPSHSAMLSMTWPI